MYVYLCVYLCEQILFKLRIPFLVHQKLRNNPQISTVSQVWYVYIRTHPNNIFTSSTFRLFHKTAGIKAPHYFLCLSITQGGVDRVLCFFPSSSKMIVSLSSTIIWSEPVDSSVWWNTLYKPCIVGPCFGCVIMDTMLITLKSERTLWHRMHKGRTFHIIISQTLIYKDCCHLCSVFGHSILFCSVRYTVIVDWSQIQKLNSIWPPPACWQQQLFSLS